MIGQERANQIIKHHGTNDPEQIISQEGMLIVALDFGTTRLEDFIALESIFIPQDFKPGQRRTLLSHCLGHYFLHDGNTVWMRGVNRIWNWNSNR